MNYLQLIGHKLVTIKLLTSKKGINMKQIVQLKLTQTFYVSVSAENDTPYEYISSAIERSDEVLFDLLNDLTPEEDYEVSVESIRPVDSEEEELSEYPSYVVDFNPVHGVEISRAHSTSQDF
jgi:hypothetical protein